MAKLALLGGEKSFTLSTASVFPQVNEKGRARVNQIMESGNLSQDKIVGEFEERFKNYVGAKYAVCQSSGTMSIQAGLFGMGIGRGDEVIVPSYTFFLSVSPIVTLGATPVFADVDLDTQLIDPKSIEEKITPKTKAIIVVHTWGNPCDMDAIMAIAKKHNIKVLEDCSHAHGAEYKGKKIGTIGDVGCFSFQASKLMYAGEGGILVTDDEDIYFRTVSLGTYERLAGYYGFADSPAASERNPYRKYKASTLGMKLRAHPLGIAIADSMLDELDERNNIRDTNGRYFDKAISDIECIKQLKVLDGAKRLYSYHYLRYVPELNHGISLHTVLKALAAEGLIVGSCGYGRLHLEPAYTQVDDNWPLCYPDAPERNLGTLPVSEYLNTTAFMAAPRFENPNCTDVLDQYAAAYHKVFSATEELLQYEQEHAEEIAAIKAKTGNSINLVR